MSEDSSPVQVYVYDLSQGLAAVYSLAVLGVHLDAIYHTSVVVRGKEYYIDQGVKVSDWPGKTKYGTPREILNVGDTYIPQEVFEDFLDDLRNHEDQKYHALRYDLFDNNCNHFTDVVIEFLAGCNLEERILGLPQKVLDTPNGKMLKAILAGSM